MSTTSSTSSLSSATLSSLGVGSGLDVNGIISKLMSIESQPLNNLNTQKAQLNTQLSAYGQIASVMDTLKTSLAAIKDASNFNVYNAASSSASTVTASASSSATPGTHSITVTQLASSEIQVGSASFATTTDPLSFSGTLDFTQSGSGNTSSVTISSTDTLQNVVDNINNATDNIGISASILNDGTGNRLVLTAKNPGTANSFTVGGDQLDSFGYNNNPQYDSTGAVIDSTGSITQNAQDANLTVDGIAVTKSSNSFSDVISGVTLNLQSTGSSTISTSLDTTTITKKLTDFATAYNNVSNTINNLHKKGGTLEADSTAMSILTQLQGVFNTPASIAGSSVSYLAQIGISFQKDGSLAVDSTALNSALSGSNLSQTLSLLTDPDQGFASRLYNSTFNIVTTGGLVTSKQDSINSQMSSMTDQAARMQVMLDSKQTSLQKQYSALDSLISNMNSTSAFLTKQLK